MHYHVCSDDLDYGEHSVCRTSEDAQRHVKTLRARDECIRLCLGKDGPGEEYHIHECDNAGCERRFFPPVPEGGLPLRRLWTPRWVYSRQVYDRAKRGG
jgi:hypothetical protein